MESTSLGCTLASVLGQSEWSAGLVHPVVVYAVVALDGYLSQGEFFRAECTPPSVVRWIRVGDGRSWWVLIWWWAVDCLGVVDMSTSDSVSGSLGGICWCRSVHPVRS